MIYEVYVDDMLLYYPNDETYSIFNSKLEQALNEAGSFECDVPVCNPRYNDFRLRSSMIQVLKDGAEIFYGEIREVTDNFDFTRHIYAVGELAFLFDSIQPQYRYQTSPSAMFKALIGEHNKQVEERKQFAIGNVEIVDPNDYVYRYTNNDDTLTAIREKLCAPFGGYLRIRKANGNRYLDIVPLNRYGNVCTQEIQFGVNMLDYSNNKNASDIATSVIPLGERIDEDKRTPDAVEGLDEYLTIREVNNGYDYIVSDVALANFGMVKVVKHFEKVTDPKNLRSKAEKWLESAQYAGMELTLKAVDLNILDVNIESFEVGDIVHAWAEPFGMDTSFPVQKKTIYLNDLSKNQIVLSDHAPMNSFTKQSSNAVQQLTEDIPEISPMLQQARERALAMLLDETSGGHVIFEYKYNDKTGKAEYIEAISLCNAEKIENATTRWRWANGAFGYMKRAKTSDPWTDVGVAMTAAGEVVANFITAGTMRAERIRGGILALGGKETGQYANGSMVIYDSNDSEVGRWDKDGIVISKGHIQSGNFKWGADPSNPYSEIGTFIDLEYGTFASPLFAIDRDGNAHYNGAIYLEQLNFVPLVSVNGDKGGSGVIATINTDESGLKITSAHLDIVGAVTFSSFDPELQSNINGKVSKTELYNSGTTTINGGKIRTGTISSEDFEDKKNDVYSKTGICFDLTSSIIKAKNFAIDADGNAYFKGNISASQITSGTLSGRKISGGTISGTEITTNKGKIAGFSLDSNGFERYKDNAATSLKEGFLGVTSYEKISSGEYSYPSFRTNLKKGMAFVDTATISGGGFVVCNGGENGDSPTGTKARLAPDGTINTSDRNMKHDIELMDVNYAKAFIDELKPSTFEYNGMHGTHYGFIAQDVEEILKKNNRINDLIEQVDDDGIHALSYTDFIAPMVKYIQELSNEIESLKDEISKMKGEHK